MRAMVLARIRCCTILPTTREIKFERARVAMSDFMTTYAWKHTTMIDYSADVSHMKPLSDAVVERVQRMSATFGCARMYWKPK
jgi:hypothetical protein